MEFSKGIMFCIFILAFAVSLITTPVAMKIAPKIGAMDIPKDGRKLHKKAIPRFGGMGIFLGTMTSTIFFLWGSPKIIGVVLGGTLIYILGVVDDLKDLPAAVKFSWQTAVAVLMYSMGIKVRFIHNYFGDGILEFGTIICFVVTVLWIVGITNTINLIDGLDGLAAGVSIIAALSIAYVAYIHGEQFGFLLVCFVMLAVAGGAMGFLPYNFYPAKVFMGDGGSLFLGFMIAILSVVGPLKRSTIIAVVIPVLVLGIPIFDTFFAIIRRLLNGQPIMKADKGHLHHHLMASGYGQLRAVLMLYGISADMGMAAVLVSRELYKDAFVLIVITILYLYVFLTDPNRNVQKRQAVDIAKEERQNKHD